MFRIKVCGVTRPDDARRAAEAGVEAIGINFCPASPRFVGEFRRAQSVLDAVPPNVPRVGVFVNATAAEIRRTVHALRLDWVQLHGNEEPSMLDELSEFRIIKALRPREGLDAEWMHYLADCQTGGRIPDALLVDAYSPAEFGGTGKRAEWGALPVIRERFPYVRLILAGGLTAGNVAEAIRVARPDAVDVASGVENAPGEKEGAKIDAFVAAARRGFAALSQ